LIDALLSPLCGLADDDDSIIQYDALDINSESDVKQVLMNVLLPHYQQMELEKQTASKCALAYALLSPQFPFRRTFDSCLIPFDHPEDPKLFFIWLWDVLFSPDRPALDSNETYVIDDRPEVTYRFPPYEP